MDPDRPAPGRLEVVRHMLNSDDRYHDIDYAHDLELLNRYLAKVQPRYTMRSSSDLTAFCSFRSTVRELLVSPRAELFQSLDEVAQHHPLTVRFEESGTSRLRGAAGVGAPSLDALVSDAIAGIHEAMLTDQWSRLRACRRYDCGWIYYDATPGKTMRWCTTDPCGNVMKTRAYRARLAQKHG